MNFDRIRPTIDVDRMQHSHVSVIGGAFGLSRNLVRCGLGAISLLDFDYVNASNPARQDLYTSDIGLRKTEATAIDLRRISRELEVECHSRDVCAISDSEFDEIFGHTDLFVFATDSFPAQARGHLQALRMGKPAIWIGLYRGGRAGEIVYHVPGLTAACYRCVCSDRFRAFQAGATRISSAGGTILDLHLVDAIAGYVAVGILTRGADNRMGQLIDKLGTRNLLQIKIDPDYRLGDKDIFGQYLGNHPANFSFTTIALPMDRDQNCPDCAPASATSETIQ